MTVRRCLPWPDPRLRTAAEPVKTITDEIRVIWQDMVDTMEAMPGVGLAAPQIGIMMRLAVVDASQTRGRVIYMANPEILQSSPELLTTKKRAPIYPACQPNSADPRLSLYGS